MDADSVDLVKEYLRGQNLEQLGRVEEAIEHYEVAVEAGFDSTGPYDRLITIYAQQARHADVMRVASSALDSVRTHPEKIDWYRRMRAEAARAVRKVPRAAPKRPHS